MNARSVAATLVLATTATIASCGARNDYTATERHHPHAVNIDTGELLLRHTYVEVAPGSSRQPVYLRTSIMNTGDTLERLVGVGPAMSATTAPLRRGVALHPNHLVSLQATDGTALRITGIDTPPHPGATIKIALVFTHHGTVSITVPVHGVCEQQEPAGREVETTCETNITWSKPVVDD